MKILPVLAAAMVVAALAGCSQIVALDPADDAVNPLCADVSVRLPDTVNELDRHETNAQGTGAWGTPSAVLLRCGVPVPDPTATLPCYSVDGIDWLFDQDGNKPNLVYTTYGRDPAIEVILDPKKVVPGLVLLDLAPAVGSTAKKRECTVISDSLGTDSGASDTPTASPTPAG